MPKVKWQCRLPAPIWEAIDKLQEATPILSRSAAVSLALWSFDFDHMKELPEDIKELSWREGRNVGFLIPQDVWDKIQAKTPQHTIPEIVALAILSAARHPRKTVPAEFLDAMQFGEGKKRGRPKKQK